MSTQSWLWGLMLGGGLFILAGLLFNNGAPFPPNFSWAAFGFSMGAGFIMWMDAFKTIWRSKAGA